MAPHVTRVGDLTVAVERPAAPTRKPPVLLIHGMFGGAWYWESYQALLARHGFESHAINLRGHLGSRPVPDIGKVSMDEYVVEGIRTTLPLLRELVADPAFNDGAFHTRYIDEWLKHRAEAAKAS